MDGSNSLQTHPANKQQQVSFLQAQRVLKGRFARTLGHQVFDLGAQFAGLDLEAGTLVFEGLRSVAVNQHLSWLSPSMLSTAATNCKEDRYSSSE